MQKRLLNMQADKIEMVLAAHKAPARVWGGRLTARTVQFHLAPAATTKLHTLQALTEELALALGASSARLTRHDGTLSLEVPRPDAQGVAFADLVQRLHADDATRRALAVAGTALLGLDQAGVPLLLRLAAPEVAHCLIAGTTGSGKTELARTLVASLLLHQRPHDLQVALFDPKGRGLAPFAAAPHLLFPVVVEPGETLYRMQFLVSEMERREREGIERPRLVVVVDELADLLQSCGVGLEGLVRRLVQRGRSAGVSVVACTQKPSAQAVGSVLKANFPVRLVGKVASAEDARVAAGVGGTRAERLAGRGDFLLIVADQQIRFQAARIPPEEITSLCAAPVHINKPVQHLGGLLRRIK
ncbi:MAG TPA: DNA translocase FtsK [Armatimonadota bacterium]|nr:DNA translocase FtsK [Armatimonadota bacterium]